MRAVAPRNPAGRYGRGAVRVAAVSVLTTGLALAAPGPRPPVFPALELGWELVDPGERLLVELHCTACHAPGQTMESRLQPLPGPDLERVAVRLRPEYLHAWLRDPLRAKPGTTMPDLLHGLTEAEREAVRARTGWRPDEDFHRFFLARSAGGQLVAAALFLTEFTVHGPVRVAVGLGADGRVRGVTVVELTEETYPWVKPLLDRQFTRAFIGHGPGDPAAPAAPAGEALESMPHFYGQVIAGLVHRAAVLHDVAIRRRGEAA